MSERTVLVCKADEGGYWVEVPALPGCLSQGWTVEEALEDVREAVAVGIPGLKYEEDGQEIPEEREIVLRKVEVSGGGG